MRGWVMLVIFLAAPAVAPAKPPPGQGRSCDERRGCDRPLACVTRATARATCELLCGDGQSCPEDQRCVRDAGREVCRPFHDGLELIGRVPL